MADISKVKNPDGNTYNVKDSTARDLIANKADKTVATTSANGLMSKTDKAKLDGIGAGSNVKSVNGKTGAVTLAKGDVGLGNVDNTADADKSVKSAASVPWGGVTDKPSSYPPSSHTHTKDQITDFPSSLPASDVYAWAKAASKPSYSASEIGAAPTSHNHDDRYEIAYRSNFASNSKYIRLGIATMRQSGDYLFIRVYSGSGFNGQITQDRAFDIHLRTSNGSGSLYAGYVEYHLNGSSNNDVYIVPNSSGTTYAIWIGLTYYSGNGFYIVEESNGAGWSNSQTTSNSIPSGAIKLTQKNIAYTSDIPTSLPANGGNATTVNGHSVNADVPSGAKFTDTTYSNATTSAAGLMSSADKAKLDGIAAGAEFIDAIKACPPAISHRMIYRGKNLGTSFTTEQSQAVQNGTFTDMYVGDYWVINGKTRRIGDIDYFYGCGDTSLDQHHLLIIDDEVDLAGDGSTTHFMNDTDTTAGGFKGSKMWQSTIPNKILPDITTAFGSHLLTHREYISNAVTDGVPSDGEWVDTTYNLFNETMYYGSVVNGANSGGHGIFNIGCSKNQIALFKLNQFSMNRKTDIWLRDVISPIDFALVDTNGIAGGEIASDAWYGVLGYYLIH